jgi:DNA polymerase III subunit beta
MSLDLTTSRNDLVHALNRGAVYAAPKAPMPVLSCVLLEASDGKLTATSTDTMAAASSSAPASVVKHGAVLVDARKFGDIVRSLQPGDVGLVAKDTSLTIKSGKARFKLATLSPEEFPVLPPTASATPVATMDGPALSAVLLAGTYAIGTDGTRPWLAEALVSFAEGALTAVTTDGNRLAVATGSAPGCMSVTVTVPARGLTEIRRLCADVEEPVVLQRSGKLLLLTSGETTLSVRLGDEGGFPPWRKVIPASSTHRTVLPRDGLVDAIRRAALVNESSRGGGVRLEFEDGLLTICAESDGGEAREQLETDKPFKLTIGASAGYLVQALSAMDSDEVALELSGPLDPIVLKQPDATLASGVVMPLRIA